MGQRLVVLSHEASLKITLVLQQPTLETKSMTADAALAAAMTGVCGNYHVTMSSLESHHE